MLDFNLPFPPSVNASYRIHKGRRIKGKKIIEWELKASISLNKQAVQPMLQRSIILYGLQHPDKRLRDAANYEKVTTDFLVAKGILQGDDRRYIKGIFSFWLDEEGEQVNIKIIQVDKFKSYLELIFPTGHNL